MSNQHLATYLNDHRAGSVAALEMLRHLEQEQDGRVLKQTLADLRGDIEEDQKYLDAVMERMKIGVSVARKAVGWLSGVAAEIKLRVDDPERGAFLLLETVEALSIGIEGKRLLWRSLSAVGVPAPHGTDFQTLIQRAEEQRERVEGVRLEAVRAAFGGE